MRFSLIQFILNALFVLWFLPCSCLAVMTRSEAIRELGLKPGFSEKDLKSAYRKRSLETHPDKGGSDGAFIKVAEAFEVLSSSGHNNNQQGSSSSFNSMNDEERMQQAEEMFFQAFDEFFDEDGGIDKIIDKLFGSSKDLSWGAWIFKSIFKKTAKLALKGLSSALENDNVQININGQTMSGSEFNAWKEKIMKRMKERKEKVSEAKSDL